MSTTARTWQAGDPVAITDPRSAHHGERGRLVARYVGKTAGRPWWTVRLDGPGWMTSEFEDSLERPETGGVATP